MSNRGRFLDSLATRSKSELQASRDVDDKPPSIIVDCPDEETIWMDDLDKADTDADTDTISSEGNTGLTTGAGGGLKHRPASQGQLWQKEEVILSLTNLPAGEAALSVIPTLWDEALDKLVQEIKGRQISQSEDLSLLIPRFANGCLRKASLVAENETALSSTPTELLSKWPNTCLLVACWLGHVELVKLLLEKGAQVSYRDVEGRTCLHLAASNGSLQIIEELLRHGANPTEWDFQRTCTALHCAAAAGDVACVQRLIKAGADINAGLSGKSPLHYAVQNNAVNCAEALLRAGASPNNPQVYTETPLHVAVSLGALECVKLLLEYKADVRVQMGSLRSTPLHLAAEDGNSECAQLLLEAGAPAYARNSKGQTPLHLAAWAQSMETVDILLAEEKPKPNVEDLGGRTPLLAAVSQATRSTEVIRALIKKGANVNKPDQYGYTPLHIAALNANSCVVLLLLSKGADMTARTNGGVSALSFIIRKTPDVMAKFVSRLDQAITLHDHELGDVDCELRLDYAPLVPGIWGQGEDGKREREQREAGQGDSGQGDSGQGERGESDLMLCLIELGQRHILKHPLCESFLHMKWLKIRKFFLFSLIYHSIFVAFFTAYISVTFIWDIPKMSSILFWFVLLFTLILASKEIFQIAHGIRVYAKGWENALQWSVILTTGIVLMKPTADWQHHVAALGILFVWLELMMVVGRFPMFGLYVQMFTQVAINFFKFLGAYLCLIIGFSLGFSILHKNYKSFQNPLVGLLKTIIMLSGELEFEDVFFDKDAPILFAGTTHLLWLAFVVLVTVILANLMMGLAVSDIQELRQCAGLDRLVRRAELVAHLESFIFSKLLDYAPKKIVVACRTMASLVRPPHHCSKYIRPNNPRENRLPKELIKTLYRLVSERKTKSKTYQNNSMRSLNENGFGSNRLSRLYSNSSFSETNKQQLSDLAMELKKCSTTISLRLDSLTTKIEAIAKEIDLSSQLQDSTS